MIETHEFLATCDEQFISLAREEIQSLAPGPQEVTVVGPGVLRVLHGLTFEEAAAQWAASPPIFVRHICPVQIRAPLTGRAEDAETLAQYAGLELAEHIDPQLSFSVQTRLFAEVDYRPFAVNEAIAAALAEITGAALDVRSPQQVVSAVIVAGQDGGIEGLLGLSRARQNLSDWAGGVRRFAREEGQISRSEFKLLEALEVFGIDLPARSTALDLGASPGGWTRVLRAKEIYVTAVDPGHLDARLADDRGIRFKRMTAEGYLRDEPDQFDLIVNDMRMDARDSARMMARFAPYLYPHGMVIMTIKLPERNAGQVLDHALKILDEAYTIAGVRQLFHNRREVTVWLRKD